VRLRLCKSPALRLEGSIPFWATTTHTLIRCIESKRAALLAGGEQRVLSVGIMTPPLRR
jgi:hypothetical protein